MTNNKLAHAGPWIAGAYMRTLSDIGLWAAITALYLLLIKLFSHLPFAGVVLLVWVSPVIAAGAFGEAAGHNQTKSLSRRLIDVFFGVLGDRSLALPVMSVATVLLGAWVFLRVIAMIFGVDGVSLSQLFTHRDLVASAFTGILLLIFWTLQVGLVMTALYVVAGIMLSKLAALDALERTFTLLRHHPLPIALTGGLMVLPLVLGFYGPSWVWELIVIAVLAPLTLTVYLSYNAMIDTAPSPLRSSEGTAS